MNCKTIEFSEVGESTKFSFWSSLFWQLISVVCRCLQSNVVSSFGIYCWKKNPHQALFNIRFVRQMNLMKEEDDLFFTPIESTRVCDGKVFYVYNI